MTEEEFDYFFEKIRSDLDEEFEYRRLEWSARRRDAEQKRSAFICIAGILVYAYIVFPIVSKMLSGQ